MFSNRVTSKQQGSNDGKEWFDVAACPPGTAFRCYREVTHVDPWWVVLVRRLRRLACLG